ncbi:MAG: MCP four helix bundle domain-containing protein [Phycisphaerales bacterium]|nr:MCP four helix bundle domain-containing protein [Phycisphaerales bacterium]
MKIMPKLLTAFGTIAVICGVVGYIGIRGINTMSSAAAEVNRVRLPSLVGLSGIESGAISIRAGNCALCVESLSDERRRAIYAAIDDSWKTLEKGWELYEPLPQTQEEAAKWKELLPVFEEWKTIAVAMRATLEKWQAARAAGDGTADGLYKMAMTQFDQI